MDLERVRRVCLSFPAAAENVQWGDNLVFKIAGRIFAIAALEPGDHCLSFKCSPEVYPELLERPGIVPAPYLARAHWVALRSFTALPGAELESRLRDSYDLVVAKLPRQTRNALGGTVLGPRRASARPARSRGRSGGHVPGRPARSRPLGAFHKPLRRAQPLLDAVQRDPG